MVGGEPSINFVTATDVFRFDPAFFAIGNQIHFVNALAADLPDSGVNVIVLQNTDDATLGTPFGAANASNLIAAEVTAPGAGLFVYFNSSLGVLRLVYSPDLSVGTADLKILARMTNLTGNDLVAFADANFDILMTSTTVPVHASAADRGRTARGRREPAQSLVRSPAPGTRCRYCPLFS